MKSPSEIDEYERAIGRLAISWAQIEHGLDACISVIFHKHGGNSVSSELPLNAKAKTRYFRKSVEMLPNLAHASKEANDLAKIALYVLHERNWCIHGAALTLADDGERVRLSRLARPTLERYENRHVTVAHINKVQRELCGPLSLGLAMFLYEPLGDMSKESIEKIFRRFGIEPPV